jgi:methylthioribose-1-phosphate isomerase
VPSASIDWSIADGLAEIPIEERDAAEVAIVEGLDDGQLRQVRTVPETSPIRNYGFDVTPARLITGLITDRGVCPASERGLLGLYPERKAHT